MSLTDTPLAPSHPCADDTAVAGTVSGQIVTVYLGQSRTPRTSFRLDTADGPRNVQATGTIAQLIAFMHRTDGIHDGSHIFVHTSPSASGHGDRERVPTLEVLSIEVTLP